MVAGTQEAVKMPDTVEQITYYEAEIARYTAEIGGVIYSEALCRRKIKQYRNHVAALCRRAGVGT